MWSIAQTHIHLHTRRCFYLKFDQLIYSNVILRVCVCTVCIWGSASALTSRRRAPCCCWVCRHSQKCCCCCCCCSLRYRVALLPLSQPSFYSNSNCLSTHTHTYTETFNLSRVSECVCCSLFFVHMLIKCFRWPWAFVCCVSMPCYSCCCSFSLSWCFCCWFKVLLTFCNEI